MSVVDVFNKKGEKISQVDLADGLFNVPVKPSVMHEVVTMQLASRRAGSASVKHRSDVRGSQRKLFRQKGTGRARRGNIKSPLLRGGGSVFGPDPRSFVYKVPKKIRKSALKMALSCKFKEDELLVIDDFELEQVKTKEMANVLSALDADSALIITNKEDEALTLSARNIAGVKVMRVEGLNVYDI
ncbi:50S ribosomal protein L4, partial [Thermodesulfobacteriota bacterium]